MTGLVNEVLNIKFVFRSHGLWSGTYSRVIITKAHTRLSICMALPKFMIPRHPVQDVFENNRRPCVFKADSGG